MEDQKQPTGEGQGLGVLAYLISFLAIIVSLIFHSWPSVVLSLIALGLSIKGLTDASKGNGPVPFVRGALIASGMIFLICLFFFLYTRTAVFQKNDVVEKVIPVERVVNQVEAEGENKENEDNPVPETGDDPDKSEEHLKNIEASDSMMSDEEKAEQLSKAADDLFKEMDEELED